MDLRAGRAAESLCASGDLREPFVDPMLYPAVLSSGGGQERGLRSGTVPTPLVVGFGAACEVAQREMAADSAHVGQLAARLLEGIRAALPHVYVNGSMDQRYMGNMNLSFAHVEGESLLMGLKVRGDEAGGHSALRRRRLRSLSHFLPTCDGEAGRGGVVRLCLHVRVARAFVRAAGAGSGRGAGAHVHPLWPGSLHHRGRGASLPLFSPPPPPPPSSPPQK